MPSISANHHHLGIGSSEKMDMQALESSMRSVNLGVEIWQGNAVFASTSCVSDHSDTRRLDGCQSFVDFVCIKVV